MHERSCDGRRKRRAAPPCRRHATVVGRVVDTQAAARPTRITGVIPSCRVPTRCAWPTATLPSRPGRVNRVRPGVENHLACGPRSRRGLPDETPASQTTDLRRIILHVIEETARHAGHLDAVRELIDGRTGLGPR
ncbi:DUF664 domain-containing protein [Micromonospora sp. WMMB235]|uniref:mycothiol transferase n=1 Tax=Micromonospora sp. WMMB235 TaxID=1172030 RepID=UPI001C40A25B|nr:DUF664 domain-containing protein [Micromonospora sp. WMMB235]